MSRIGFLLIIFKDVLIATTGQKQEETHLICLNALDSSIIKKLLCGVLFNGFTTCNILVVLAQKLNCLTGAFKCKLDFLLLSLEGHRGQERFVSPASLVHSQTPRWHYLRGTGRKG